MVEQNVRTIITEVLGLDEATEIELQDDLVNDLGAESIDFIEICFRVEQVFKLAKVNPGDIFPTFLQAEEYLDPQGNVKESVRQKLAQEFPHVRGQLLDAFVDTRNRRKFVTVQNLVSFVEHRIAS
jgi:acyl carrier protein